MTDRRYRDEAWLREQYVERERSTLDIAEECGVSHATVSRWLNRHGIGTRDRSAAKGLPPGSPLRDADWLREQYVERERSMRDIAEECGVGPRTVNRWLNRHGIETRPDPSSLSGEDHPNHRHGNSGSEYEAPKSRRREVYERDEYTCRAPGCSVTQTEHLRRYDERLHVHHLKKAREMDDREARHALSNLITLCQDCHLNKWEKMADAGLRPQVEGLEVGDD